MKPDKNKHYSLEEKKEMLAGIYYSTFRDHSVYLPNSVTKALDSREIDDIAGIIDRWTFRQLAEAAKVFAAFAKGKSQA